jgi:hypothetical protein
MVSKPRFCFYGGVNVSGSSRSLTPPPIFVYFVRWTFLFNAAALPMATKHSPQSSVESVVSFSSYNTSDSASIDTDETHVNIPGGVRFNDSVGSLNGHESAYLYPSHQDRAELTSSFDAQTNWLPVVWTKLTSTRPGKSFRTEKD